MLHLFAAVVFCVLGFFLVVRGRGSIGRMFSLAVFVFSVVFLLSMSGVFHLLALGSTGRMVFQRLDHAGILLSRRLGFAFVKPLVYSGLAYSLGGITEYFSWPILIPGVIGPHEIFHVAAIVGIAIHWYFIGHCLDIDRRFPPHPYDRIP